MTNRSEYFTDEILVSSDEENEYEAVRIIMDIQRRNSETLVPESRPSLGRPLCGRRDFEVYLVPDEEPIPPKMLGNSSGFLRNSETLVPKLSTLTGPAALRSSFESSKVLQPKLLWTDYPSIRKAQGMYSKEITDVLMRWLNTNKAHPYPTEGEKRELCEETGLDSVQLNNWMSNARRRKLNPKRIKL